MVRRPPHRRHRPRPELQRRAVRGVPLRAARVPGGRQRHRPGHSRDLLDPGRQFPVPGWVSLRALPARPVRVLAGGSRGGRAVTATFDRAEPYCQADETGGNGTPVRYWVPWVAADGTVYDGGDAGYCGEPPEATNGASAALPSNETYGVTGLDGTGSTEFDVFNSTQNATLGCSASVACSLVAVPIMGVSCDADVSPAPTAAELAQCEATGQSPPGTLAVGSPPDFPYDLTVSGSLWWSPSNWRNRITVPLTFAPTSSSCPVVSSNNSVDVYGSELLLQATSQWEPYFCLGDDSKTFTFNHVSESEPEARDQVATGAAEAAFTSDAQPLGYGKPVVNAPVAVTGFTVSFSIDGTNGDPDHDAQTHPVAPGQVVDQLLSRPVGRPSRPGARR